MRNKNAIHIQNRSVISLALACAFSGASLSAHGIEIPTGSPDVTATWNNTVRYNIGVRVQDKDSKILNNLNFDDSDSKFGKGDLVTNRVDLLSEFDLKYRGRHGLRVTGAAWYDNAYDNHRVKTNPAFDTPFGSASLNTAGGRYTNYTKRWNNGPSGEILDAFVFTGFDAGDVPVDVKAGRHMLYWGESLFTFAHGVSYSQGPLDLRKAFANPGTEAKELFLPLTQISGQAELTRDLTIGGQYFFEWDPTRVPDGGTYFGQQDFFSLGGGGYVVNPVATAGINAAPFPAGLAGTPFTAAPIPFVGIVRKPKDSGDFGVKASWRPDWLDGTLGFYYREFTDKMPTFVNLGPQAGAPIFPSAIGVTYLENVKLYGVSLAKQIGGLSVGAEVNYRKNGALMSIGAGTPGTEARGDTLHALVNVLGLLERNALWDTASYAAELTYSRRMDINSNPENFFGVGYGACSGQNAPRGSKWDGCSTRDNWGLALQFAPMWYQVMPGVDLSAPMFLSVGLKGNSPVAFGGNQGFGNYSLGLTADVRKQFTVSLAYNGYLVRETEGVNQFGMPAITSVNGLGTLSDRGWVSLTLKSTF